MTHPSASLFRGAVVLTLAALRSAAAQPAVQPAALPADTLPLTDLRAFRAPAATWRVAGDVTADREHALVPASGSGVLLGTTPGAPLLTTWEHGDLELELEYMVPKGGRGAVYLQGRYAIRLTDSWAARTPTAASAGGIDGHAPRVNAARAPGLWQTLRIRFVAPRFDAAGRKVADARFARVEQNGVVIHDNLRVAAPTRGAPLAGEQAAGPLALESAGIAVRHVRFKRFGTDVARVSNLRYRVREGAFPSLADATAGAPTRQGATDAMTSAIAGASDKFAVMFDGTLRVPNDGDYLFDLGLDWVGDDPQFKGTVVGGARLAIDGRDVLVHAGRLPNETARVRLTAGDHAFTLAGYKNRPWWDSRVGVELFVEGPGVARQPLHAVQAPDLAGAITVEPATGAVVLRSFVHVGDGKRTHAVSVGDPAGVHFSMDLARAALLAAWRGPFAETTEMWHDRGNDQVMRPLGSVLTLNGAPSLAFLPAPDAAWPDSTAGDADGYRGYTLDAAGRPTFLYRLRAVDVEDRIRPADDGASLRRDLRLRAADGTSGLVVRLASGSRIRRLSDGSYVVDDGDASSYYVVPVPNTSAPVVRSIAGRQELVVPVQFRSGEAAVAYTLVW